MTYYHYSYTYSVWGSNQKIAAGVCTVHPFLELHTFNNIEGYENHLLYFREISEEEYKLFKKLESDPDGILC